VLRQPNLLSAAPSILTHAQRCSQAPWVVVVVVAITPSCHRLRARRWPRSAPPSTDNRCQLVPFAGLLAAVSAASGRGHPGEAGPAQGRLGCPLDVPRPSKTTATQSPYSFAPTIFARFIRLWAARLKGVLPLPQGWLTVRAGWSMLAAWREKVRLQHSEYRPTSVDV
jgi:hypothetical protein